MSQKKPIPLLPTKLDTRDKIYLHLFKSEKEAEQFLTEKEMVIKRRWVAIYSKWLDDPCFPIKEMIEFVQHGGDGAFAPVGRMQAYRDIEAVQSLLGRMQNATKAWVRHVLYETTVKAIKIAMEAEDTKAVAINNRNLIAGFNLDKDDVDAMDWEKLIPPSFEPTDDITILGIDPIENIETRRKELRKMFGIKTVEITEAEIINE